VVAGTTSETATTARAQPCTALPENLASVTVTGLTVVEQFRNRIRQLLRNAIEHCTSRMRNPLIYIGYQKRMLFDLSAGAPI
jgi:hypothetical protein